MERQESKRIAKISHPSSVPLARKRRGREVLGREGREGVATQPPHSSLGVADATAGVAVGRRRAQFRSEARHEAAASFLSSRGPVESPVRLRSFERLRVSRRRPPDSSASRATWSARGAATPRAAVVEVVVVAHDDRAAIRGDRARSNAGPLCL